MPVGTALIAQDETILRLFPPLRSAWGRRGQPIEVPISGRNARRVLLGSVNLKTARRFVLRSPNRQHQNFGRYLCALRRRYGARPLWLLLDRDPSHIAAANQRLARELNIKLLWLPKQWPELNPMDQLWKELKRDIAANRQYASIEEAADYAEAWLQRLTTGQVFQKAGLHSPHYWLNPKHWQ